jgi:ornithine carbamoyltransferase
MRSLITLDDWAPSDVEEVFALADAYRDGRGPVRAGCAVMFFPATSLRTRVTFERGAALMGL